MSSDDKFKTWLNHTLRAPDVPHIGQDIVQVPQYLPLQRDHFFEIQHIVNLIMEDDDWPQTPIMEYFDLASLINDRPNIFRIEATRNQQKKGIAFAAYPTNAAIGAYLAFTLQNGTTVEDSVRGLATAMANRGGANAALTRRIGTRIKQIMGWP